MRSERLIRHGKPCHLPPPGKAHECGHLCVAVGEDEICLYFSPPRSVAKNLHDSFQRTVFTQAKAFSCGRRGTTQWWMRSYLAFRTPHPSRLAPRHLPPPGKAHKCGRRCVAVGEDEICLYFSPPRSHCKRSPPPAPVRAETASLPPHSQKQMLTKC